jgi:ABC-type Fe3+-hydroxamate transport system substrate-binding protein
MLLDKLCKALLLVGLIWVLVLAGCQNDNQDELSTLTFIEKDGYTLTKDLYEREFALVPKGQPIPSEVSERFQPSSIIRTPVERLVVASGTYDPGIIFMLGKGDTIIGSSDPLESWDTPEMREIYKSGQVRFVGLYNAIDYEAIVALNPDLILASGITSVDNYSYLGFPSIGTYNDDKSDVESYYKLLVFMGVLFGVPDIARERVAEIRNTFKDIEEKVKDRPQPSFTWGTYWDKRVFVLSSHYWLTQAMVRCGADYVFKDITSESSGFSEEEFISRSRNADIYFASYGHDRGPRTIEELVKRYPNLYELKTFRNEGVVAMLEPILWQDSGYLDEIALDLVAFFHPDLYPDRKFKYIRIMSDAREVNKR